VIPIEYRRSMAELALLFELRNYHFTFVRLARHAGCDTDGVTS
jgi:hypothetical protein